jgi:hypothetical protein
MLGTHTYRNQLRAASGVFEGFDGVLGSESPHQQCKLAVSCHLDGSAIDALDIGRAASAASVHLYDELNVLHVFGPQKMISEIGYCTVVNGLPHSRQRGLVREVINPHEGHILCDRAPLSAKLGLRNHQSNTIVNSTIDKPKVRSIAFMVLSFVRVSGAKAPRTDKPQGLAESLRCGRTSDRLA